MYVNDIIQTCILFYLKLTKYKSVISFSISMQNSNIFHKKIRTGTGTVTRTVTRTVTGKETKTGTGKETCIEHKKINRQIGNHSHSHLYYHSLSLFFKSVTLLCLILICYPKTNLIL